MIERILIMFAGFLARMFSSLRLVCNCGRDVIGILFTVVLMAAVRPVQGLIIEASPPLLAHLPGEFTTSDRSPSHAHFCFRTFVHLRDDRNLHGLLLRVYVHVLINCRFQVPSSVWTPRVSSFCPDGLVLYVSYFMHVARVVRVTTS